MPPDLRRVIVNSGGVGSKSSSPGNIVNIPTIQVRISGIKGMVDDAHFVGSAIMSLRVGVGLKCKLALMGVLVSVMDRSEIMGIKKGLLSVS